MPASPSPTVDRSQEFSELTQLWDQSRPVFAVVYGRPFVGKTRLLEKKTRSERFFYFLCGDTTPERNRRELLDALEARSDPPNDDTEPDDWRDTVEHLLELAGRRDDGLVVILDEAQHVLGDPDVQEALADAWPDAPRGPDLTVVAAATAYRLEDVVDPDAPLTPHLDYSKRVEPFDYLDAGRMTPERPAGQQAYVYGIFGGRPGLLSSIDPADSLGEAIRRNVLHPEGRNHLRLSTLLERVPTIREPGPYRAVLVALAEGYTETTDVARAAGLGDRKTMARRALETLGELGFVRRRRHFRAGERAAWQNHIADPALHFWHRFVHPNRSEIERGGADEVWRTRIVGRLDDYMQLVFERIAEDGFRRFHDDWDLPGASVWRRWSGRDLSRRPVDIDIAAELDDGRLLTGLVEWSSEPAEYDLHFQLRQNLEALKHLGEEWATDALSEHNAHGHIYVSAGGFTDYFRNKARTKDQIHLVTLRDLYPHT